MRLVAGAVAGWAALAAIEAVLLYGVLRLAATVMGPDLLPSLKVVLDMGALAACGWVAGRVGRPRVMAAAAVTAAGLAAMDLTPYLPLNVPFNLSLIGYAAEEPRYLESLLTMTATHALLFGSLFLGARFSRPREASVSLRFDA